MTTADVVLAIVGFALLFFLWSEGYKTFARWLSRWLYRSSPTVRWFMCRVYLRGIPCAVCHGKQLSR